jgi:hypothetical protein
MRLSSIGVPATLAFLAVTACGARENVLSSNPAGGAATGDDSSSPTPLVVGTAGGYQPDASCGPGNCRNGCCDSNGLCVDPPTAAACGSHGSPCVSCGSGICTGPVGCEEVRPDCSPLNCAGCCLSSVVIQAADGAPGAPRAVCAPGTFGAGVCGNGGAPCNVCGQNEQCRPLAFDAGGYCQANTSCNSANCAGCCVGDICAAGTQKQACGYGGSPCMDCGSNGACAGSTCFGVSAGPSRPDGG